MILKLTRRKTFIIGVSTILAFLALNRLNYVIGSSFTTGQVIQIKTWSTLTEYKPDGEQNNPFNITRYSAPIIKFSDGKSDITFQGETNMKIASGETVDIIYKTATPENAEVFSFTGFLLAPLLYCLVPLLLLTAAVYSFININETITIDSATIFKKKK